LADAYGTGDDAVTIVQAAFLWLRHHSQISGSDKNAIIIGASSVAQLDSNLEALAGGALDARVVTAFDDASKASKAQGWPTYFR
jgi:aflatoxin B1 aldehyde reductase